MRGFHSVFQIKVLRTFIQKCTPRILKLYQIPVKNIFPMKDHIISCNGGRSLLNKGPFAGVCTDIEDILRHPSRLSFASSIHGYLALFSKHHQVVIQTVPHGGQTRRERYYVLPGNVLQTKWKKYSCCCVGKPLAPRGIPVGFPTASQLAVYSGNSSQRCFYSCIRDGCCLTFSFRLVHKAQGKFVIRFLENIQATAQDYSPPRVYFYPSIMEVVL